MQTLPDRLHVETATITSLAQDGDGFLWMGTQQGILRYDGGRIIRYGRADGLPAMFIDQIAAAPDGSLWAVTGGSIVRFRNGRFQSVALPVAEARIDHAYQIIAPDETGATFVASSVGLLYVDPSNASRNRVWTTKDGLPSKRVEAVFRAADGYTYFLSGNHPMRVRHQDAQPQPLAEPIHEDPGIRKIAILKDGQGVIWVRTEVQLLRLHPGDQRFVRESGGIPIANDFGIPTLDRQGALLLPTTQGLYRRHGTEWLRFGDKQGLPSEAVFSALEDREGAIWIGLGGSGVVRWPGSREWSGWTRAEGLPDSVVWSVRRDRTGRLWVGTGQGLAMWDARSLSWRRWSEKDGLAGPTVREILEAPDGAIWTVSTPGGTSRLDPATGRVVKVAGPPGKGNAAGIALAPDGAIWVGNHLGLRKLKRLDGTPVYEEIATPPQVMGMTAHPSFAPDGTLWTCGRNGIARFDGAKWEVFTKANGLLSNVVPAVIPKSGDEIWFRYLEPLGIGNLKRQPNGSAKLRHLTTTDGLYSNSVFLTGFDRDGGVWAGGTEGLNRIGPDGRISGFTRADGLIWNDLNAGSFFADTDGSLYFGTSRGLARYLPGSRQPSARPANVLITSVKLGKQMKAATTEFSTSAEEDTLEVTFAELSLRAPESTPCRYRLNGLEKHYTETLQREARYPSLPPGSYRFEVACRLRDQSWSAAAILPVEVGAPWWAKSWFRFALAILLAAIVLQLLRRRTRSLELDRQRLEQAIELRSSQLARANRELEEAALTDPLTQARNRRYFQLTIENDLGRVLRSHFDGDPREDLIFYLVDLDHFKQVNDEYGHQAGDQVLVELADRLKAVIRASDTLIRWGGEEFLILARGGRRETASALATRVLEAVGGKPFRIANGSFIHCTCSAGWLAFPWEPGTPSSKNVHELMQLVDQALYLAKDQGRNRAIGLLSTDADFDGEMLNLRNETLGLICIEGPSVTRQT